jgi:UDP-glucose 4-epimerase
MNILITGATGRIGSRLAKDLIERGEHVRTLVVPDDPNADSAKKMGVECISGSLTNFDDVLKAVDGVDAIYHLGAVMLFHQPEDQTRPVYWDINVHGTYNVFQAAALRANRPLKIIYAASDEVYPAATPRYQPVDETHPRYPKSFYGLGKVLGEEMLRFYGRTEKDIDISIARFTLTLGVDEVVNPDAMMAARLFYVHGRLNFFKKSKSTHPPILEMIKVLESLDAPDLPLLLPYDMNGQPYFQEACDARDTAQGLRLMLYRPEANDEVFNLTPPTIVNMAEFIPYMAKATGRRYVEAKLPFGFPRIHASGAKARALLGYNPQYSLFDMVDEATGRNK